MAAQKFLANAANDTMQVQKRRKQAPAARLKEQGFDPKDQRRILTTEDLAGVLSEV
jgi:hypothetical protein